jgi:hypothetical protein
VEAVEKRTTLVGSDTFRQWGERRKQELGEELDNGASFVLVKPHDSHARRHARFFTSTMMRCMWFAHRAGPF